MEETKPGLHSEFHTSPRHRVKICLGKERRKEEDEEDRGGRREQRGRKKKNKSILLLSYLSQVGIIDKCLFLNICFALLLFVLFGGRVFLCSSG